MIAKFDDFNRLKEPILILTNPEGDAIGILDEKYIKNLVFNPKFNDISEISFDFYKHESDVYKKIYPKMRISVEGYGSFIISSFTEHQSNDGNLDYKPITLKSTEYELEDIQIPYIDGTYQFYNILTPNDTLMGMIMEKIPNWSIDYMDPDISSLYRTFEIPNTNILDFLLNDVQEAYGCLFVFDTENRKISVYNQTTYVYYTDILLTNDELIENLEKQREAETIITALTVYGSDDLSINAVNPLGTSTIYNFKLVKPWMSEELRAKIETWENLVNNNENEIRNKNIEISASYEKLTSLETEYSQLSVLLNGYNSERDVLISANENLDNINILISQTTSQLTAKQTEIDNETSTLETLINERSAIQNDLNPANYFGKLYSKFLSYVYENEYTQDNISAVENMSYEERIEQITALYNDAKDVLEQSVNISDSYSVNTKGFIFNKKFINHTHNLECGHLIGVEDGEGISYYPITEFEVNYEDKSINIILGNRFNSSRAKDMFADLVHNLSSANKAIEYISSKKANSDEISDIQKFINNSLDLSKNNIISADKQSIEITDSGYHGRKVNNDGSIEGEEIAIVNNTIAFTRDNWNTCSLALGKIQIGEYSSYGLVAETLIGKFTLSEYLKIINSSGNYTIDENGLTANNSTNHCQITINPNDSNNLFSISSNDNKKFYIDSSGNVVFSGTLSGAEGTFSGTLTAGSINADTVKFGDFTIEKILADKASVEKLTAVDAKVDELSSNVIEANNAIIDNIDAAEARIGKIEANYISADTVSANYATITNLETVDAKFNNINASNITSGTLSADRIDVDNIKISSANITGTLRADQIATGASSFQPAWGLYWFSSDRPTLSITKDDATGYVTDVKLNLGNTAQLYTLVGIY